MKSEDKCLPHVIYEVQTQRLFQKTAQKAVLEWVLLDNIPHRYNKIFKQKYLYMHLQNTFYIQNT